MKECNSCGCIKDESNFWNQKRSPDGKDSVCGECRVKFKEQYEATPQGLYELKARCLMTVWKPCWFPHIDAATHQVDHRFSLAHGYRRDVPLRIIGNRANLEPLTIKANRIKGSKSSISIFELYETFITTEPYEKWVTLIDSQTDPILLRHWAMYFHEKGKRGGEIG